MLGGFNLSDILTHWQHSVDFLETRADYINKRLRFMLLVFMVAVPAWIPMDFLLLQPEHVPPMIAARLGLALCLSMLWMFSMSQRRRAPVGWLLAGAVIAPLAFYVVSMRILSTGTPEPMLAGYENLPILIVAMTGLFPITVSFGVRLSLMAVSVFVGYQYTAGTLFSPVSLNLLWTLALMCGIVILIQTAELLMLLKLYRASTCDSVTGLVNRRVLVSRLESEIEECREENAKLSVIMVDLDFFKRVNDTYGHLTGDQVLRATASALAWEVRKVDVVARYGGEEFVIVLPRLGLERSKSIAERLRRAVQDLVITTDKGKTIPVTASLGVSQYREGEKLEEFLSRADALLYRAKANGRNRVECDASIADETEVEAVEAETGEDIAEESVETEERRAGLA